MTLAALISNPVGFLVFFVEFSALYFGFVHRQKIADYIIEKFGMEKK